MQPNPQDITSPGLCRRDPAEGWGKPQAPVWMSRSHVTIVAYGCPTSPDDHLAGLQSAVGRFVGLLFSFRMPRFQTARLARPATLLRQFL